jgi:hypothetical protein
LSTPDSQQKSKRQFGRRTSRFPGMASIHADYHRCETKNSRKPVPIALSKSQVSARPCRSTSSN